MRAADGGLSGRFSNYERTVKAWAGAFGRDRLLLLKYDDVRDDPAGVAARVCAFLGVPPRTRRLERVLAKRPNRTKSPPVPDRLRRHFAQVWLPRTRRFAKTSGLDLTDWIASMEREVAAATPADRLASLAQRAAYELPVARGLYPLARGLDCRRRAGAGRRTLAGA